MSFDAEDDTVTALTAMSTNFTLPTSGSGVGLIIGYEALSLPTHGTLHTIRGELVVANTVVPDSDWIYQSENEFVGADSFDWDAVEGLFRLDTDGNFRRETDGTLREEA